MSGNTSNTAVWGGADVLVGALTATIPVGNAAFDLNREEEVITAAISSGDATVTGTGFSQALVGATVTGTGIPALTTVLSVTDATHFELSANATATNASASLTIGATSGGWSFVGLLDGGQGFEESVEVTSTDHEAWGYGVVATTFKGQKTTKKFTALEDNQAVLGLVYDVDDVVFDDEAGTYVGDLKTKDYTERVRIAFVVTSGDTEKRMISKNYCNVSPTDSSKESEDALQSKGFTATIYPDNDRVLWYAYKGASA